MTAAGVRWPPRPKPTLILTQPPVEPVPPTVSGQLLPSRSLRALKAVLDRQRKAVA